MAETLVLTRILEALIIVILTTIGVRVATVQPQGYSLAIPGRGEVVVEPSNHTAKHEAGTLPASAIRTAAQKLPRGWCAEFYYSAKLQKYLIIIETAGHSCGGLVLGLEQFAGMTRAFEYTAFGGSECIGGGCAYWYAVARSPTNCYKRLGRACGR